MSQPSRPTLARYGGAILAVLLATVARLALRPALGAQYPFGIYVVAVALAAWLCGTGPAVLALASGGLLGLTLSLSHSGMGALPEGALLTRVGLYLVLGVGAIRIGRAFRAVRLRLEREAEGRRRAEGHLALQALVLESMTEGVSIADEDGTIVYTNPAEDRLFGYGPGELVGRHLGSRNDGPPEEGARFVAGAIERLKAEGSWSGEWRSRRKDGTPFWAFARITEITRDGRRYRVCVQEDVTGRKAAEAALREREGQLRQLADSMPQIVWTATAAGAVDSFNGRWFEYTGMTPEASLARDGWREAVHPDDQARLDAMRASAVGEGELFDAEVRLRRADGAYRWHLVRSAPARDEDGRVTRRFGTATDIDDRRRSEEALRRGEERLRLALEAGRMGTWDWDIGTGRVEWSDNLPEIHGLPSGGFDGTMEGFRLLIHPEDRGRVEAAVAASIEGRSGYEVEFRVLRPDGSVGWMSGNGKVYDDGGGRPSRMIGVGMDITGRKLAEERLRASEAQYRAVYDQATVGIAEVDLAGRFLRANDRYCAIVGYGAEELIGLRFHDITHPDDPPANLERFGRVAEGPSSYTIEKRYVRKDGTTVWCRAAVSLIRDGGERPERVVAVVEDVTERRRAEAALLESEGRFRGLMEQAPFSVQVLDPDGRTLAVNRAWEDLWGLTLDRIADYNVLADAQLEAKGVLPLIRRAFDGQPARIPAIEYDPNETIPGRTRHGDPRRWVAAVAYPLKDPAGRVREVVLVHDDITDRMRAEEVAERRAAELDAVIDSIPDAVYVGTAEGMTKCNANALEMLGFTSPADLRRGIADLMGEISVRWPGSGEPLKPEELQFARALRGETVIEEVVIRRVDRDEDVHVRVAAAPVLLNGKIAGAVAVNSDVTERRRFEEQLRDADRRKDDFLATLAHELRNPLAPIRTALHLMREPDDGGHERVRAMAERQVVHLARLIDDLMDVARISKGRLELHREVVDLNTVVRQAVETARPQLDDRGHRLSVSLPGGPIRLEADPTRLEQVFWNLLNNAAKYTGPGGRIDLTAEAEGSQVLVRVKDTGIGIEPAMLPRLFQMFVQLGEHRDHSQGGLGIGLGLVRTLVELHGGSISANSEGPGRGSEFLVRLPVSPGATPEPARPKGGRNDDDEGPLPRRRILIVDDNVDAAVVMARVLARIHGQEVEVAHDGPSALEVAARFRPEVVLLDIGLPGMDGHEVARRLRGLPEFERTPLVALTGWGQEADRRRSREAGFDHHLVKPVDPDHLVELLRNIVPRPTSPDG
ncbi:PAS domain S-box protein [Tautonia plasticadhaerens]|uniref:histidine kinase n=1 Tax=Tautonia plasticadhaerens TaxID=2527974 RepID=A0A518H6M8_9BACT|nr:PAS domain S-box protein [Tautonia plasticadhaerens]QDV36527.1 Aerobic respiration control sensor protein ArcB [Tautonia plasticadhaerens]